MGKKNLFFSFFLFFFSWALSADEYNGYIVKFDSNKSLHFLMEDFKSLGTLEPLNVSFGEFARLHTDQKNLHELKSLPGVEYIEPNWIVSIDPTLADAKRTPTDPSFRQQWALRNDGINSGTRFLWWIIRGRAGEDVNAVRAWDITKGSDEVVIAVIDTGVDYNHPDLRANMWQNDAGEFGYNFVENNNNPIDRNGHGTHCAGIIGAVHNNIGISGLMSNVRIMALKFLSDDGRGDTADAIRAIDYGVANGAHILSNSWGGGGRSQALEEAIIRANNAGVTFVAAAGNSAANSDFRPMFPAGYDVDNVIAVGSHDGQGSRSSFSNFGANSVHVFAPGTNILSTVPNNRYQQLSGTSMAAPYVSAAVGLLISEEGLDKSPSKIRDRIMATAVRTPHLGNNVSLSGRLDAYRLLRNITQ